jgi:succinate dehydrogenase / fumarate reductase cytochrome b subunit|tara:strand:- start:3106 stop:3486 length:381 start_codon:yes stop_codon:yes gene_type:complete
MNRPRPLSPHLQIYKPQITSILSILHRMTGVFLSIGSLIIVLWIVSLSLGAESYSYFVSIANHWFGHLVLMGFSFALYYHLSNGIRHLFWDAGFGFELKSVYISGSLVVVSAFIMTILTWSFVYFF